MCLGVRGRWKDRTNRTLALFILEIIITDYSKNNTPLHRNKENVNLNILQMFNT